MSLPAPDFFAEDPDEPLDFVVDPDDPDDPEVDPEEVFVEDPDWEDD